MSIHIDNLARIIRDSVTDADATREEWEAALDQAFIEDNDEEVERAQEEYETSDLYLRD